MNTGLGRYWGSADKAALTTFPEGDALITFSWADGAQFTISYESHKDALSTLARLGFSK